MGRFLQEFRDFFRKGDMVLLLLCIMFILSSSYNPFIYFRF